MAFGKRQLVLAALVVALGAAVYLNWQFTGDTGGLVEAGGTASEKSVGEAQLVNASAASSAADSASPVRLPILHRLRLIPVRLPCPPRKARHQKNIFRKCALRGRKHATRRWNFWRMFCRTRRPVRSQEGSVAQAAVIAQNVLQENNIESLVKAKGFPDCVAFLQNGECSIVVQTNESSQNNAIVIKDIVSGSPAWKEIRLRS